MSTNLADLLLEHPFGDHEPLIHDLDHSWTVGQARARVRELAAEIATRSPDRSAVAVKLTSGAGVVIAMTAIWHADRVFVPVNPRLPTAAVDELLDELGVALLIDDDGFHERSGAVRTHDAGIAFILWTSGTTGRPKPILHRHDAYLEIIDRTLGPLSKDRRADRRPTPNLIPTSMALNAGIYNVLFGFRAGAPVVLMNRFSTRDFATLVKRHEIRSTILPPAAMTMLNDDESITDLTPLKYVRSVTAPLSPFQARRFIDRFGVTVLNGYGQAEIGEVIGWTAADAKEHPERLGAAGRPSPGISVRIDAPDENGVGELLVKPSRALDEGARAQLVGRITSDGYVRTGDLARIDDAGFVWIEGRLGDLINRGGAKVVPDEVEEVLRAVPQVKDAAVVGLPDARLGQVPVAFVVEHSPVSDAELEAACRESLVPYKVPVRFERVAGLPRNEVGKLLRRQLSEQHS